MIDAVLGKIMWLGHDSFYIKSEKKTIFIDPYQLADDAEEADIVLVSHAHYDHCSPDDIKKILKKGTVIITEDEAAAQLKDLAETITVKPGKRLEVQGLTLEAVPSYNTNKHFHPKDKQWLGFIITVEGVRIYHAGDTDHIPEMINITADIALLPVSGTYVMTAEEAVRAALDINPQVAIPMHVGAGIGSMDDAKNFAKELAGKIRVEILEIRR